MIHRSSSCKRRPHRPINICSPIACARIKAFRSCKSCGCGPRSRYALPPLVRGTLDSLSRCDVTAHIIERGGRATFQQCDSFHIVGSVTAPRRCGVVIQEQKEGCVTLRHTMLNGYHGLLQPSSALPRRSTRTSCNHMAKCRRLHTQ